MDKLFTKDFLKTLREDLISEIPNYFNFDNTLSTTVTHLDWSGREDTPIFPATYSQGTNLISNVVEAQPEEYKLKATFSALALKAAQERAISNLAKATAAATEAQIDSQITSLFPGFSVTVGQGQLLTEEHIKTATDYLHKAGALMKYLTGVLSYNQYTKAVLPTSNIKWRASLEIPETTTAHGAIYAPTAIGLVTQDMFDLDIQQDPNNEDNLVITITSKIKAVELVDAHAVEIFTEV